MLTSILRYFDFGSQKPRDVLLDFLRAIAIFGVILIHSLNYLVNTFSHYYAPYFGLSGLWRFGVPFFVIVAGYFAPAPSKMVGKKFFGRLLGKLGLPFLVATVVSYGLFWGEWSNRVFLKTLLNGQGDYAHWFVPLIFLISAIYYLTTFSGKYFYKIWTLLGLGSLALCFFPMMGHDILAVIGTPFVQHLDEYFISYTRELSQPQFYLVYFAAGIALKQWWPRLLAQRERTLVASGFATLLFGTLFAYDFYANPWIQQFSYFDGWLALFSLSLFVSSWLLLIPYAKSGVVEKLSLCGKHSLWIMLWHGVVIKVFVHLLWPYGVTENYVLFVLLLTFLVFALFGLVFAVLERLAGWMDLLSPRSHERSERETRDLAACTANPADERRVLGAKPLDK